MSKLNVTVTLFLALAAFGCSLAQIARLPPDLSDPREARASIESCLSAIGMLNESNKWPYSEIIADDPDLVSAWSTPPPQSKWELFLNTYKGALAWVKFDDHWSVRFVKHDESFPPAFANCMRNNAHSVSVQIEDDWYFDIS
jgi:hypothetical protein